MIRNRKEIYMDKLAILLLVVAAVCTLITVITEFTKEVGILKKIPTSFPGAYNKSHHM